MTELDKHSDHSQSNRPTRARFSFTSILVSMAVVAALAVGATHFWKGVSGDQDAIGRFVIASCIAPLLLLVIASLTFQIIKKLSNWI